MAKTQKIVRKVSVPAAIKRGRKPLTEAEKNPKERFIRVAGMRTAKICSLLKGLRSCANVNVYEYTPAQVELMLDLIRKGLSRVEKAYSSPEAARKAVAKKLDNPLR